MTLLHTKHSFLTPTHLVALFDVMKKNHDVENAIKIAELYHKLINQEYIISFTGHFSAGKSSMINTLLETDILPKSPIPTSGNIVEIRSGKEEAQIFFSNHEVKIYREQYDINTIRDYCKDNQNVKKVVLSTKNDILPQDGIIIDTPGIDAADDNDRIMTESSLHLADKIVYIMDYNHVQSEVNLTFLQNIQARGIPFIIVINQIDKHNDEEMSFQLFKDNVKQTFEQWRVFPETIHYTSLIDADAEYNSFQQFKQELFTSLKVKINLEKAISQSATMIIHEHKNKLKENIATKIKKLHLPKDAEKNIAKLNTIHETLAYLEMRPDDIEHKFQTTLNETLKNAYLMPANLRDSAMSFLESRQPNFKVGFFTTKKKIMTEQEKRIQDFLNPLQKNIEATIQWRLRDKLIAILKEYEMNHSILTEYTQKFKIDYTKNDLIDCIKPGAKINGTYLLNYTEDVSTDIKEKFRLKARERFNLLKQELIRQTSNEINTLHKQKKKLETIQDKYDALKFLEVELAEQLRKINLEINHPMPNNDAIRQIREIITVKETSSEQIKRKNNTKNYNPSIDLNKSLNQPIKDDQTNKSYNKVLTSLEKTLRVVEQFPGFQAIIRGLKEKKEKLTHRELTVALFGAFSAGKSSFANALIGKKILPTSPNPTTAVINRISPPTANNKHGTVVIKLKQAQTIAHDILDITNDLAPPVLELNDLIKWLNESKIAQDDRIPKIYQAYLQALIKGYNEHFYVSGQTLTVHFEEFSHFITDETKACFADSITLYHNNTLTKLGISLVDTPGADSVNARHTDMAFDYIKQADAILYVTYYNHALSRVDKNFLMQLGRVKDAFELDKMFFIINAADLAENQSELQLVSNYVEEQLIQLGIRSPRIYPVSSKKSLHEKNADELLNEQMIVFERAFYQFINHELLALSINSAIWEIKRVHQLLLSFIENANLDSEEKQQQQLKLEQNRFELLNQVASMEGSIYEERITQRIDRQLYFVNERLSIRFHDIFKDHFNPATVSHTGGKMSAQLNKNLKHLLTHIGDELVQELQAVSLRMEFFIKQLIKELYEETKEKCRRVDKRFMLSMSEDPMFITPSFTTPFTSVKMQQFNKVISSFKSLRAFFEKSEKDIMKDELYKMLQPYIKNYLNDNDSIIVDSYHKQWQQLIERNLVNNKNSINDYIDNHITMLEDPINLSTFKESEAILAKLLSKLDEGENKQ